MYKMKKTPHPSKYSWLQGGWSLLLKEKKIVKVESKVTMAEQDIVNNHWMPFGL